MSTFVPILMYHSVAEHPATATRRLSVRPQMLAAQLALMRQQGFTTVTVAQFGSALRGDTALPPRPIVLTFDDGYADFVGTALPLLAEYSCRATLFIPTGWVADAGEHAAGCPLDRMLSWRQIDEVAAAGMEIGAHSHSHARLDQLPDAALGRELSVSKVLLEDRLGREVPSMAYPFGHSSARVRAAVRAAGYRQGAAVSNAIARPHTDLLAVSRLTIRRSTSLDTFRQIINGQRIAEIFLVDRALTTGWAVVRRSRYTVARIRGRG